MEFPPFVILDYIRTGIARNIDYWWDVVMEIEHSAGEYFVDSSKDFWAEFRRACKDPFGERGIVRYAENVFYYGESLKYDWSTLVGFWHKMRRFRR
jgi:hypothetical protein